MDEQKEKSRITPEVAYVKSIDLLEKGISNTVVNTEKVKFYQGVSIFSSLAIGAILGLTSQNIAAFLTPIILINGSVLPLTIKVLKAFKDIIEDMKDKKEKLQSGELNPNEFYNEQQSKITRKNNTQVLDRLSTDTSKLTSEEREMLSKFSSEEHGKTM